VTVHAKESKNWRLVRFERGHNIDMHLDGASVTKTATLLGVSRTTVPKVMLA
jgi:hypothetical protein